MLETREVMRLGGSQPRKVDVRLVAATNRDLRSEVNRQAFRSDLYYRLSVVELTIPPLRERSEDIPLLVERFIDELAGRELGRGELRSGPRIGHLPAATSLARQRARAA